MKVTMHAYNMSNGLVLDKSIWVVSEGWYVVPKPVVSQEQDGNKEQGMKEMKGRSRVVASSSYSDEYR